MRITGCAPGAAAWDGRSRPPVLSGTLAVPRRMSLRRIRLGLVTVAAVACVGCDVRTEIGIRVDPDGGGLVEVALGLDDEALRTRPGLLDELVLDDLAEAGWTITAPDAGADDLTWIGATQRFGTPAELEPLIDDVAGQDGPFEDFSLDRADSFDATTFVFAGSVDLGQGIAAFADPTVISALDGEPLGESVQAIEERFGAPIDELFGLEIAVDLPGAVESNASSTGGDAAVWRPSLAADGPIELRATSVVDRTERVLWRWVAVAAGTALVIFLTVRVVSYVRRRRLRPRTA